jgi:hypothetical protein
VAAAEHELPSRKKSHVHRESDLTEPIFFLTFTITRSNIHNRAIELRSGQFTTVAPAGFSRGRKAPAAVRRRRTSRTRCRSGPPARRVRRSRVTALICGGGPREPISARSITGAERPEQGRSGYLDKNSGCRPKLAAALEIRAISPRKAGRHRTWRAVPSAGAHFLVSTASTVTRAYGTRATVAIAAD